MFSLPRISNPAQYEGLYAFDFGDHVSMGYTAAEIRILQQTPAHRGGSAYQIYRVNESGGFELRGVQSAVLTAREAICFLRFDGAMARLDYDGVLRASEAQSLPCEAELRLARSYGFHPPDLTALVYPAWASHLVAGWLGARNVTAGDLVHAGIEACQTLETAGGLCIATCRLASSAAHRDRSELEVLASTGLSIQR